MAHMAPHIEERQEFWKPVIPQRDDTAPAAEEAAQACAHCGAGLMADARFCHACGTAGQAAAPEQAAPASPTWYNLVWLRDLLGQTNASLAALILGCACLLAAVFTGMLFTATTLLDWQAVQLWRIEWLLAALAIFAAGLLLKKK